MRKYFINPYTFIPLSRNGPVFGKEETTHAFFKPGAFTGRITCELEMFTPTVIPGEQEPGTDTNPGKIKAYLYDNHLAIPGSRLRGHLMHLMRAINSSPINSYDNRVILEREQGDHKKGFIFKKANGSLWVQEVEDEVLVAHSDRPGKPTLQGGVTVQLDKPLLLSSGKKVDVPEIDSTSPFNFSQGECGDVHWANPTWGPRGLRKFKKYHITPGSGSSIKGRWIKIEAWSGQDGENVYAPMNDAEHLRKVHRNAWHLMNLDTSNLGRQYEINNTLEDVYNAGVKEMARLAEDRSKPKDQKCADNICRMVPLEEGMFVYFKIDGSNEIISIGRHYRYLFQKGSVEQKVDALRSTMGINGDAQCLVDGLAGWANARDREGQKGRLYVEMAIGPEYNDSLVQEKNLRILSSQPPKAANFYLEGGDYNNRNSYIRGRKFYWHDSKWHEKMWDNEDLRKGEHAFENPYPDNNKKQWSKAKVIMATEQNPVVFRFTIRCVNLSENEKNLLLTALVGFDPIAKDGKLQQSDCKDWCHKIGHARPFMGSGVIRVLEAKELCFDKNGKPDTRGISLGAWQSALSGWQTQFNNRQHIPLLKRVMYFGGAYESLKSEEKDARITYPLGQKEVSSLTWNHDPTPKTFEWFGHNKDTLLPLPQPGQSQALEVWVEHGHSQGGGSSTISRSSHTKHRGGSGGQSLGTLGDIFKQAGKDKKYRNGRR